MALTDTMFELVKFDGIKTLVVAEKDHGFALSSR